MPCFKFFPGKVHVIIRQIQGIHNVILIRTVKNRRGNVKSECFCSQAQMDFQHLSDVHTGRHTQRVQHDIQRTPVRKERHILHRKHTRNHTLVPMTSRHLVAYGNLPLLRNINADSLVHARRQLVAVIPGKYLCVYNNAVFSVRYFQGSIPDLTRFFSENRAQQTLFCCQFRLSLRRNLSHQDIPGAYLSADTDDAALI